MKEEKIKNKKTLNFLIFLSLLFAILVFSLTFLPISSYFRYNLNIYDLAFHESLEVNPVFIISLITLLIAFILTITAFFILVFKKKHKRLSIFLLCASLPFLAFSFVVNIFIHPLVSKANPFEYFFTLFHYSIAIQDLALSLSFISNIILIFYVAIKLSKMNLSIREKKENK